MLDVITRKSKMNWIQLKLNLIQYDFHIAEARIISFFIHSFRTKSKKKNLNSQLHIHGLKIVKPEWKRMDRQ